MRHYKLVAIASNHKNNATPPKEICVLGYSYATALSQHQLEERLREDFTKNPRLVVHEIKPAVEISEEDFRNGHITSIIFSKY